MRLYTYTIQIPFSMFLLHVFSKLVGKFTVSPERFPLRWDRTRDTLSIYLDGFQQKPFLRRVFQGKHSDHEFFNIHFLFDQLDYIQGMVLAGILYIWTTDDPIVIQDFPFFPLPSHIRVEQMTEYVHVVCEYMARVIECPEHFLAVFHEFLGFYQSYRLQTKHSIFKTLRYFQGWTFLMDLFWMYCLYHYPGHSTHTLLDWIRSLRTEFPFVLVFYALLLYYYRKNAGIIPETLFTQFEQMLVDIIVQQNGRTGFEQTHPTLSSLETRLKRQFPEEPDTPDEFDLVFLDNYLSTYYWFRPAQSPFHQYIQSNSYSSFLSFPYLPDIVETGFFPERIAQTGLLETVQWIPRPTPEKRWCPPLEGRFAAKYCKFKLYI